MAVSASPLGYGHAQAVTVNQYSIAQSGRCAGITRPGELGFGRQPRTQGFSLVEVLVAVLVLTVGLLGLAALQATGLKATGSAQQTTLASLAAYDAAERLRADPLSVPKTAAEIKVLANQCRAPVAANAAIKLWYQGLCAYGLTQSATQPNAMTINCGNAQCGIGNCEVKVFWDDSRGGAGDRSLSVCTRLPVP